MDTKTLLSKEVFGFFFGYFLDALSFSFGSLTVRQSPVMIHRLAAGQSGLWRLLRPQLIEDFQLLRNPNSSPQTSRLPQRI